MGPELYSTKRIVSAASQRGHDCVVINHTKCYCNVGKKLEVYYNKDKLDDIDAIIPRIGASVTSYGSVIIRQFQTMGIFTTLGSLALVRSRDKLRSHQVLAREGIDTPRTAFAKHVRDIDNIINLVGGTPLIIKVLEGTQGKGVVFANSPITAKSLLETFYDLKANFIVQEFIEEANGEDIRVFVINGKVVGTMMRKGADGDFRSNLHRGGSAMAVKLTQQEKNTAIKATKALGLQIAGVDLIRSNRGPLVLEVNSSPGLEGIEKATGKDIASTIIKYVESSSKLKKRDKVGV